MRKLRLNLDQLHVETFSPAARREREKGTVQAHAKATYGCTEGWDGCAQETVGDTCDVLCSETNGGFSCDYYTCINGPAPC